MRRFLYDEPDERSDVRHPRGRPQPGEGRRGHFQAEAITETIRVAVFQGVATKEDLAELRAATKEDLAELRAATKEGLAELRAATKGDLAELRTELKAEIAEQRTEVEKLRADLTWRMVLVVGALLAVFTALDRLVLS